MTFRITGLAAVALASAALAPSAVAAPVTVNLRVEGANSTLFEGSVSTGVRTFQFTGDPTQHQCDGTSFNMGPASSPQPTRGGALATAAEQNGFDIKGTWSSSFNSPTFSEVAGENVSYDSSSGRYLAEYKNGTPSSYGSCGDPIANGDDVVFAYATGSEGVLKLTGPATAAPGAPFTVKVVDEASGNPLSGAAVGGATTGADGTASITYSDRGNHDLKATRSGDIRSNRLRVCVTDGHDGFCGTTASSGGGGSPSSSTGASTTAPVTPARDVIAPVGRASIETGHVFGHGKGPRILGGVVSDDPSGLLMVKLRLTRNDGGRCSGYSSKRERFIATKCGVAHGWYFSLPNPSTSWSYLLPEQLGPGRYVLDVEAVDRAYNRDTQRRRGVNRVVFTVR